MEVIMEKLNESQIKMLKKIQDPDSSFSVSIMSKRFDDFKYLLDNKYIKETKDRFSNGALNITIKITKKGEKVIK